MKRIYNQCNFYYRSDKSSDNDDEDSNPTCGNCGKNRYDKGKGKGKTFVDGERGFGKGKTFVEDVEAIFGKSRGSVDGGQGSSDMLVPRTSVSLPVADFVVPNTFRPGTAPYPPPGTPVSPSAAAATAAVAPK